MRAKSSEVSEICLSCPEAIMKSIRSGNFRFMSQGIFNRSGERIKSELLSRVFVDNKSVSPAVFIPIIEHTGYKNIFDYMVMEKAFETIRNQNLIQGCFSININPSTLIGNGNLFYELQKLASYYQIRPRNITIEILEREKITDFQSLNSCIRILKSLGFAVAIDDYHPIGNNNAFTIKGIR